MKVTPPPADSIGATIEGLDLREVTADQVAAIKDLTYRHKLVVFRGVDLTDAEYLTVARRFGRPQVYFQDHYHHPEHPEIFVSSNVPIDGRKVGVAGTGRFWHSDYQFFPEPLSFTFVLPKIVPPGFRATHYIDMAAVWRRLPAELRRPLEHATCFHEAVMYYKVQPWDVDRAIAELMAEFRQLSPGAHHPAVITHPMTGQESLYVSEGFTMSVDGLPHETSQRLLQELFAFVRRDEHWHTHRWGKGDLLLWDNRGLIHMSSGTQKGEASCSYRIGVYDGLPFYVGCKLEETAL